MSTALSKCRFLCDDKKKMSTVYIMTVDLLTVDILMASPFLHRRRKKFSECVKYTRKKNIFKLESDIFSDRRLILIAYADI